jgi:PleD family two-component response regulator
MNSIRLLLVEADLADAALLGTALQEIEECRYWRSWRHTEVVQVETLAEALDMLRAEPFDLVLLDLDLPDSQRSRTFLPVCAIAPHVPIVLLSDDANESLAARLVREGAQDYVIKGEVECRPLARTIENAIERNRIIQAARSAILTDPLTGLPNEAGFHAFGEQMQRVAARFDLAVMVVLATPEPHSDLFGAPDLEWRDSHLLDLSMRLRDIVSETDLVARVGEDNLAVSILGQNTAELEQVYQLIQSSPATDGIHLAAAIAEPGENVSIDDLMERAFNELHERDLASMPK